ncbi:MAG: hypothetical protein U0V73_00655 [Acidimicrobiia bacterium]
MTATSISSNGITLETDYPHRDDTWPHTAKVAAGLLEDVDAPTRADILRNNAIDPFGLDLARA